MFEKSKPIPLGLRNEDSISDLMVGSVDSRPARGGDALRAIEWSELTARLNAARELRRELRQESILCAGASGASFGDAAASFFKTLGNGERPVNPDDLEARKASCCTTSDQSGAAATGDARDEL